MLPFLAAFLAAQAPSHTFALGQADFMFDGKAFQIRSGEMHPARIPAEYWRHRIRMAKAMGLNTIAAYIFWNYQEPAEGRFDFRTGNHDIARFFRICQEEGMWVLVRPGPYCCAEWDFGGIPSYLLKNPDLKVRCMDPRYIAAAGRYLGRLADVLRPLQVTHGGPILMLQIENEYGSYGNDRDYIGWLSGFWRGRGFDIPFYTADGPSTSMLSAGSLPGCAVGLDSGGSLDDWTLAASINPGVPIFSSETYPGWLTHWGENWAKTSTASISQEIRFLLSNHKSFNLYVVHGGTNFGLTAGANTGGHGYEPDITSYDYDAPISEDGSPTPKYFALRDLIAASLPPGEKIPDVPAPIPAMALSPIPMERCCSLWDHLPAPTPMAQPRTFESLGQNQGLVLYRTRLIGHTSGHLVVHDLHDFATVFVDGRAVGTLDRREGRTSIQLPVTTSKAPVLELLVEAMGHVNFGDAIIDPKGITDRVVLDGMTLMGWQAFPMPLDDAWLARQTPAAGADRPGTLFNGSFTVEKPMDTYLDLSVYDKGYVWVNGHCLGRYWNAGPQKRLYCPATFLKLGHNTLTVLDLLRFTPASVSAYRGPF